MHVLLFWGFAGVPVGDECGCRLLPVAGCRRGCGSICLMPASNVLVAIRAPPHLAPPARTRVAHSRGPWTVDDLRAGVELHINKHSLGGSK